MVATPTNHPPVLTEKTNIESQVIRDVRSALLLRHSDKESRELIRNAELRIIKKGVIAFASEGNVTMYLNEKGVTLFNTDALQEDRHYQKTSELAGYKEIKNTQGIYELFHLKDIENGKPKPGAKPVDKFSEEYFDFWIGQNFYQDRAWIDQEKQVTSDTKRYLPLDDRTLKNMSASGALTIRDLLDYFENYQINESLLHKYLQKIIPILTWQTQDTHGWFHRANSTIRKEDLEFWSRSDLTVRRRKIVNGKTTFTDVQLGVLIPKELAERCKKIITERESRQAEKQQQVAQIHGNTNLETTRLFASLGETANTNPAITFTYQTKYQVDKILNS